MTRGTSQKIVVASFAPHGRRESVVTKTCTVRSLARYHAVVLATRWIHSHARRAQFFKSKDSFRTNSRNVLAVASQAPPSPGQEPMLMSPMHDLLVQRLDETFYPGI